MSITREQLGARLREAREAASLSQEQVAARMEVSRPAIAQMERGRRDVTSLELDRLAYLYGRDIRSFFSDSFQPRDALTVLFRAEPTLGADSAVADELRWCMAISRELRNLERLLETDGERLAPAQYPARIPRSRWYAIRQGTKLAEDERRRLQLGDAPIADVAELLESQGVRAMTVSLPGDVSGLTAWEDSAGIVVAANAGHAVLRRRFSYAHEYAHVLLDQDQIGLVSRVSDREGLREVRANAFAAAFLMPETGVRRTVETLGKGQPSRANQSVGDEQGALRAESRSRPGSQALQIYDVVHVAHIFGVSTLAALYRLGNLRPRILTDEQRERLKDMIDRGVDIDARNVLGLPEPDQLYQPYDQVRHRLVGHGLEAYRQELISRGKLGDIVTFVGLGHDALDRLIQGSGIDEGD